MTILLLMIFKVYPSNLDSLYYSEGRGRSFTGISRYRTEIILSKNSNFSYHSKVYKLNKNEQAIISSDSFEGTWRIKGDSLCLYYGDSISTSSIPVRYLIKRNKIIRRAIDGKKEVLRLKKD